MGENSSEKYNPFGPETVSACSWNNETLLDTEETWRKLGYTLGNGEIQNKNRNRIFIAEETET